MKIAAPFVSLLALLPMVFGTTGLALADQGSLLKVRSYPCGLQDADMGRAMTGSGAIVHGPGGEAMILSSSHVLYHAKRQQGFCLDVLAEGGAWQATEIRHVNAGLGLALLALPKSLGSKTAFTLDDSTQEAGMPVTIHGYPLASLALVSDQGRILTSQSQRVLLPLLSSVTEVRMAHNEYGMSGGAMLDGASQRYLGLLSHQYLTIATGQRALVENLGDVPGDRQAELIALVIPSSVIETWFTGLATGKSADLREDLEPRLRGLSSLTFGSVRFTEVACAKGDGGIGGEGVGIGGEGVGIGGSEATNKICHVEVRRVPGDQVSPQIWPWAESTQWLTRLSQHLPADRPLAISQLLDQNNMARQRVRGLYQFLTLLRDGYRPLVEGFGDQTQHLGPSLMEQLGRMRRANQGLTHACQLPSAPAACQKLAEYVQFIDLAVTSGNYYLVDTAYTRRIIQPEQTVFKEAWVFLFTQDYSGAVDLIQSLVKLTDLLDAVQD